VAESVFSPCHAAWRKIAKVAMARKLAVRLYWMWRQGWDYGQLQKLGSQGRKLFSHAVATKGSIR
jgi:hypothetical protein